MSKIGTDENPADILTKFLKADVVHKHMHYMGCKVASLRSEVALNIQTVSVKDWCRNLRERRATESNECDAAAGEY